MRVPVEMLAFHGTDVFRSVEIPDVEFPNLHKVLEYAFHYGQNDFQPLPDRCSVSVGDVIHFAGDKYVVAPVGFRKLSVEEYDKLRGTPRRDRSFLAYQSDFGSDIYGRSGEYIRPEESK